MSAFRRMLRRKGETWTLNGWSASSPDEYDDELPTGPTSVEFQAIRDPGLGAEEEQRTEKGQDRFEELRLLVDAELALPLQTQADLPVTLQSPDGRTYDLIGVEKSGQIVGSKTLKVRTGGGDAALYF